MAIIHLDSGRIRIKRSTLFLSSIHGKIGEEPTTLHVQGNLTCIGDLIVDELIVDGYCVVSGKLIVGAITAENVYANEMQIVKRENGNPIKGIAILGRLETELLSVAEDTQISVGKSFKATKVRGTPKINTGFLLKT